MKKEKQKTIATIKKLDKWKCFYCKKFHAEQTYEQFRWLEELLPKNCIGLVGEVDITCVNCGKSAGKTTFGPKKAEELSSATNGEIKIGNIITLSKK